MIVFFISILICLSFPLVKTNCYIHKAGKTKTIAENKQQAKQEKEFQRIQARQEKQQQQKQQAENDIPFYEIQLDRLYITVEDTRNIYKKACDNVNHDNALNRYGAVVKDKVVNQHIIERDKALKKLITLENQIHALEKKKTAAEIILNKG